MRTFFVSVCVVVAFAVRTSIVHSQDITTGLVAHWTFCGCSLVDQTGHGHNGAVSGNPQCVAGVFDSAYMFNGSNTVDVPFDAAFDIPATGALTLSAWVKPTNLTNQYEALFVKGVDFWDYGLYINQGTPSQFMFGCNAPNHEVFSKTTLQNNQWYFVTGVYDNKKWKLYVNGLPEDSLLNGTAVYQSSNGIGFAKKGAYRRDFFTGTLDELRMYNRALSDADVLALYHYRPAGTALTFSASSEQLTQRGCNALDSNVQLSVFGPCGGATATLDSLWLTGSSTFRLRNAPIFPGQIASTDSVTIRYNSITGSNDTAILHIRYDIGNGPHDTTVTLIGKGFVENPYLQLASRDQYFPQRNCTPLDTLIRLSVQGRCFGTGTLDSVWLEGSPTFTLSKGLAVPRTIGLNDFANIRYSPTAASNDTAVLHLRYNIGNGEQDTTIVLAGKGRPETPTVLFANAQGVLSQRTCARLDTTLSILVQSCRTDTIRVDTFWLTGSPSFTVSQHVLPWRISTQDGLGISYASESSSYDTALLHVRYVFGGVQTDTTIRLIAHAASPFLNGQTFQHLAVRSGAIGNVISLPMSVDMADSVALKNSWAMLKSVTYEIAYDRSQLALQSITTASGWSVVSVNNAGNNMRIILNNNSGSYTRPFSLGTANFQIIGATQGMTQITLQKLSLHIGQNDNEVCFSQSEDALWGVVIRPEEDVTQSGLATTLTVQPNPFDDRITIRDEANDVSSVELIDILGHKIAADISGEGAMKQISTQKLAVGSYLLICHTPSGIKTFHLTKPH